MGRKVFENEMHVYHADAVADISAPTETEIGDATNLTPQITADGVNISVNSNTATQDMLAEGKVVAKPGTRGLTVTLTALRDDETDDFWDEFEYAQEGYLIISPFGADPSSGDEVYVVKGAAQEPAPQQSGANTFQTARVEFPAEDWDMNATVASGT